MADRTYVEISVRPQDMCDELNEIFEDQSPRTCGLLQLHTQDVHPSILDDIPVRVPYIGMHGSYPGAYDSMVVMRDEAQVFHTWPCTESGALSTCAHIFADEFDVIGRLKDLIAFEEAYLKLIENMKLSVRGVDPLPAMIKVGDCCTYVDSRDSLAVEINVTVGATHGRWASVSRGDIYCPGSKRNIFASVKDLTIRRDKA